MYDWPSFEHVHALASGPVKSKRFGPLTTSEQHTISATPVAALLTPSRYAPTHLVGLLNQICLFGGCLLITYVPVGATFKVSTPCEYSISQSLSAAEGCSSMSVSSCETRESKTSSERRLYSCCEREEGGGVGAPPCRGIEVENGAMRRARGRVRWVGEGLAGRRDKDDDAAAGENEVA